MVIKPKYLEWLYVNATSIEDNNETVGFKGNGLINQPDHSNTESIDIPDHNDQDYEEDPELVNLDLEDGINHISLEDLFREGYKHNPFPAEVIQML